MKRVAEVLMKASPRQKAVACAAGAAVLGVAHQLFFASYKTPGLPPTSNLNGFAPTMTRQEAMEILNLKGPISNVEIQKAHRTMMALHHPDKGGSSFIATKINEARDFLALGCKE